MRARCELPERDGAPCPRPAVKVLTIKTKHFEYPFAVCDQCAAYIEKAKERSLNMATEKPTGPKPEPQPPPPPDNGD